MSRRAPSTPRSLALLALLLATALPGCGDAASPSDPGSAGQGGPAATWQPLPPVEGESVFHLLELFRLQGRPEGSPCVPGSLEPLADAAAIKARLQAEGDAALLLCWGDTLGPTYLRSQTWPRNFAAETRGAVVLEALAAAGVDVYVPGQADLGRHPIRLLDRCQELGIPVVLSNVSIDGRDDILPYRIIEHEGMRLAILGVTRADDVVDLDSSLPIHIQQPREAEAAITRDLVRERKADFAVVLSNVTLAATISMFKPANVHAVIGSLSIDGGTADGIAMREGTAFMLAEPWGLEIGHTTLKVVDGNLAELVNRAPLHSLPRIIAMNQADLDVYKRRFGTDDLVAIAQQVMPSKPAHFLEQAAELDANREHVAELLAHEGSYLDHHAAVPVPHEQQGPLAANVRARLARIPERLRAAFDGSDLAPVRTIDPMVSITAPSDCRGCHPAQYDFWKGTDHARSYERLVRPGHELDQDCLECHSTGFATPGGWEDPREGAPFGAVSCWECHETTWPHANSPGRVVDPLYVFSDHRYMKCADCHYETRLTPEWDRDVAMQRVRCPPMQPDEAPLQAALHAALGTIRSRGQSGEPLERDRYLEGRALVGLGKLDEGVEVLMEVGRSNRQDVRMAVEIAWLLDEHGRSIEGVGILREFLSEMRGDPLANEEYLRLLLEARDPAAQDPEAALRHLRFVLPLDPEELSEVPVNVRLYEIDALMRTGKEVQARTKLIDLAESYVGDPRVADRLERYLGMVMPPRR